MNNLKIGDTVMVQDVASGRRHCWHTGKVAVLVPEKNEIWAQYQIKGETMVVSSVRHDGKIMPTDEEVRSILSLCEFVVNYICD